MSETKLSSAVQQRQIDWGRGTVTNGGGAPVPLRAQSFAVLKLLRDKAGQLVTKDELTAAVWPNIAVTDDSLVQCITEIRKALGDDGHSIIRTVPKRGYVFEAGIKAEARAAKRWQAWAAASAAMLAVIAGLLWFSQAPPPAVGRVPAIAVLPFDDMSAEKNLAYMGDGVAEDIISMLARSPDLTVIARNSSFNYRGKAVDVRQVGNELGVNYVLEGSVRKEAGMLRISAQLVDAKTGEHLWAERFDKTGADPWALQDEVTGKIIGELTGDTGQVKRAQYAQAWGRDTANLREYDYYLRAHDMLMRFTPEANEEVALIAHEGLAEFPNSNLLRLKLGFYHNIRFLFGWSDSPKEDARRVGELARSVTASKALSPMEKKLAHWLSAYARLYEGDFRGSVKEAEIAASMAPNDAFLLGDCSNFHLYAGNYDKAITWSDFAIKNDPAMVSFYALNKGWAQSAAERYEESRETLREAGDGFIPTPLLRAVNAVHLGLAEEAKSEIAKALKVNPGFTAARWREIAFASDPAVLDRQIADLVKAGLPEK